jgi:hypothetical protein
VTMINLDLRQAQLFRMLSTLFGEEQVLPNLSLRMILGSCEGVDVSIFSAEGVSDSAPAVIPTKADLDRRCLFTVLDDQDKPRVVVDFSGFGDSFIDADALKRHEVIQRVLGSVGLKFLLIHPKDFESILDRDSETTLVGVLQELFDDC